jgi:hypothetical protein
MIHDRLMVPHDFFACPTTADSQLIVGSALDAQWDPLGVGLLRSRTRQDNPDDLAPQHVED